MNIKFSWKHHSTGCIPVCESDYLHKDGFGLIDCVLMDDGDLPYLETIPWVTEGVQRINSVATGELESSDWRRETWGVEFRDEKAKIYSLHDESYFQILSLGAFSKALQEWRKFLESKPDDSDAATFRLSIAE